MVNFLIGLATAAIIIAVGVGAAALYVIDQRGAQSALALESISIGSDETDVGLPLPLALREDANPDGLPDYDREHWGDWEDEDRDCQDTRQETLISESITAIRYDPEEPGCRVASGRWRGAYAGAAFTTPRDLQIDHMVPIGDAHRSGAWQWDAERRRAYYNYLDYPNHLIAVDGGENQSKGDRSPDEWKPPLDAYHCQYALDWINIKRLWGLSATRAEVAALRDMLATCDSDIAPQAALDPGQK